MKKFAMRESRLTSVRHTNLPGGIASLSVGRYLCLTIHLCPSTTECDENVCSLVITDPLKLYVLQNRIIYVSIKSPFTEIVLPR